MPLCRTLQNTRTFPRCNALIQAMRPCALAKLIVLGLGVAFSHLPEAGAETASTIIPAERKTFWNPGLNSVGGIPRRTTVCETVNASKYGNGTRNSSDGIQRAINRCPSGQVVMLSAGEFQVTKTIIIRRGITLRGQGPELTRLKMPPKTNSRAGLILVGTLWPKHIRPVDLASDGKKGAKSITLVRDASLYVGEIVAIDQLADPKLTKWGYSKCQNPKDRCRTWYTRPNRPIGQVLEVASINDNTITFTTPLHIDFKTARAAQLTRFTDSSGRKRVKPVVKYAGVEDLYVSGGGNGQGNIRLSNAAYSWISGVESAEQDGTSIAVIASFRCVVRGSYIHTTRNPTPGGAGYGLAISSYSADNLIEDNIIWNMNKVMVMQSSGGGNVIGYNYLEDGWIAYDTSWVETGLSASHMAGSHMALFEGNRSFNFGSDNTWGNAIYITVFRNHLTGKRRSHPPLKLTDKNAYAVGLAEGHWWYTFVGNVLGLPDQKTKPRIWQLGYNPEDWDKAPDDKVLSTVIRSGNYEFTTGRVKWGKAPKKLPASLYLKTKPAFFGAYQWPWVDPLGKSKTYTLPAKARFDAGKPFGHLSGVAKK